MHRNPIVEEQPPSEPVVQRMTRRKLKAVINDIIKALGLGQGSVRTGSWFYDYAAFEFACFASEADVALVRAKVTLLCEQCDWTAISVTGPSKNKYNSISVIISRRHLIDTRNDTRLMD